MSLIIESWRSIESIGEKHFPPLELCRRRINWLLKHFLAVAFAIFTAISPLLHCVSNYTQVEPRWVLLGTVQSWRIYIDINCRNSVLTRSGSQSSMTMMKISISLFENQNITTFQPILFYCSSTLCLSSARELQSLFHTCHTHL